MTSDLIRYNGEAVELLPDNKNYKNRMEIPSESSDSVYIVSQFKKSEKWTCSCFGHRRHGHCKHLDELQPLLDEIAERGQIQ